MLEMRLTVDAPDLAAAIIKLAAAITPQGADALQPAPAPVAVPAPAPIPVAVPAPVQAPAVPVSGAPTYTLDQLSRAGVSLVDAGKVESLMALLAKYNVAAITQLAPAQYGAVATELRALGAQI